MGREQCYEMFQKLMDRLDLKKAKKTIFDENSFKALVEILKLGKTSFPGLVIRQPELDLVMKGTLKACFNEQVWRFVQGRGKSNFLEEIWRELRSFESISVARDGRLLARPSVSVCIVDCGQLMELIDVTNKLKDGAPVKTLNAAVKIRCQSRVLVRIYGF